MWTWVPWVARLNGYSAADIKTLCKVKIGAVHLAMGSINKGGATR